MEKRNKGRIKNNGEGNCMTHKPTALFILPHLKIQNANTISSPLTWGFPAVSAFLGFVHALERKIRTQKEYSDYQFYGVGIICHDFTAQIARKNAWQDGVFCLTRNPLGKNEKMPPIVEEGRAHLEVSLVIQISGQGCDGNENEKELIAAYLFKLVQTLRLAGGSILPAEFSEFKKKTKPKIIEWSWDEDGQLSQYRKYLRPLLPGFVLISREDLLAQHTAELQSINPKATALDVLLDFSAINYEPTSFDPEAKEVDWIIRKKPGWIVPIPVGFDPISPLYEPGTVLNARDSNYPFQFVESIYSLGQWISLHRVTNVDDIFWHYHLDSKDNTYRCVNNPPHLINLT
jgi:CRISPR-associated protein Csy2